MKPTGVPTRSDFHEAINGWSNRWFSACLQITRSRELAEDAVQEALFNAWHKRHQFEGSGRLDAWIHRIAVNAALQLLRKRRVDDGAPLQDDVPDDSDNPECARMNQELESTLTAALGRLSEMERECFTLKRTSSISL